jgi:hypothetical protein
MQGDSETELDQRPSRDIWSLPRITSMQVARVRYRRPRRHAVDGRIVEQDTGVEIVVETDGEIPIRALAPALHVGSAEVAENEQRGTTTYRFFVLDEQALQPGDPITLGWVGHPPPDTTSRFRYEPPSTVTSEPPDID